MLPEPPWGEWMSVQPHSSFCIIPVVATEPTSNTQHIFSPNIPNCQPSMGIWELLANKLELSYEMWCKTYIIPATVCKYLPSPPVRRRAHPHTRWALAKSFLWRHVQGYFPIFLLVFLVHIISQPDKNGVCWLSLSSSISEEFWSWIECIVCLQGACQQLWPLHNLLHFLLLLQWATACILALCPNFY